MVSERPYEHEDGTSGDQVGRHIIPPVEPELDPEPEGEQPELFERGPGNATFAPDPVGGQDRSLVYPEPEDEG